MCFRLGGLVGALGFGGLFAGGEVAAFVADFAAGGFAGPGAGAVFAGFVDTDGWLLPVLGFFHGGSVALLLVVANGGLTPWRESGGEGMVRWQ